MSDALTPIRQVYGLDPDAGTESPESRALHVMREVLDARPALSPSPAALTAVLARAAEPADALTYESEAQAAALAPVLDALDRLPRPRPDASVVAAIEARAAQAASSLAAVRHVYAGGQAPASGTAAAVEADVLHQSREAVERSISARPRPRPSSDAVEAVLARAAEARRQSDEIPAASPVEAAVLAQSLQALDRLPRHAPSAASLDAVLVAAATASSAPLAPVTDAAPAPAADRAPVRSRRRPVGVWAGASALALAALIAVAVLPRGAAEPDAAPLADVAEAAPERAAETIPEVASAPEVMPSNPDPTPLVAVAPSGSGLAASAAISGFVPVAERAPQPRAAAPTPAAAREPVSSRPSTPPSVRPALATAASPTAPAWEASDDVRALSLRLQELDDDALDWDEPVEAFGAPAARSLTSTPGLRSVGTAPARARMIDNDQ